MCAPIASRNPAEEKCAAWIVAYADRSGKRHEVSQRLGYQRHIEALQGRLSLALTERELGGEVPGEASSFDGCACADGVLPDALVEWILFFGGWFSERSGASGGRSGLAR